MQQRARAMERPLSFIRRPEPRSEITTIFDAERQCIRNRITELRGLLGSTSEPFDRQYALGMLEALIFDISNEFAEEEMVLMKCDPEHYEGHRCSHEALLTAIRATKRAVTRCRGRDDLRVAVEVMSDWLFNHFQTVDVRDEAVLNSA